MTEYKQIRIQSSSRDFSNTQSEAQFNGQLSDGKAEIRKAGATRQSVGAVDQVMEKQQLDASFESNPKSSHISQNSVNHYEVIPAGTGNNSMSCQISSAHSESVQDNPLSSLIK